MDAEKAALEARRTKWLRRTLAVSGVFAAFWLYDFCGLHIGGVADVFWQSAARSMWIMATIWAPGSSCISIFLTDRRNFIYLPAILVVNFGTVMAALHAVS
jgi:hypothetical protein